MVRAATKHTQGIMIGGDHWITCSNISRGPGHYISPNYSEPNHLCLSKMSLPEGLCMLSSNTKDLAQISSASRSICCFLLCWITEELSTAQYFIFSPGMFLHNVFTSPLNIFLYQTHLTNLCSCSEVFSQPSHNFCTSLYKLSHFLQCHGRTVLQEM